MLVALRSSGLCRAVAGCDLNPAKREAASEAAPGIFLTADYEEMLARPDVEAVAIYTPDHLHAAQIEKALLAGKHVLATKPLIRSAEEGQKLLAAQESSKARLQVAQSTRFGESFQRQREEFEQGALGEIELLDAYYIHRTDWLYEKSAWVAKETDWVHLGLSHPVDLARWYLGPIRQVHAYGAKTELAKHYHSASPDALCVNLLAESGRIARVMGNFGVHELGRARSHIECFLMGSKSSSLARYPDLRFTRLDRSGTEIDEDYDHTMAGYYYRHELKGMHYGEFCNCADYFASKIRSGEPNSPDLNEGLETVKVLDAIVRSIESGRPESPA